MQRTGNPVSRTQREARTEKGINIYNHKNLAERSSAATAQWQSTTPPKRKTISQCLLYGQLELKPSFGLNFNLLRLRSSSFIFSCCRRQDTEKTHKHTTQKTEDTADRRDRADGRQKTKDDLCGDRETCLARVTAAACVAFHIICLSYGPLATLHSPRPFSSSLSPPLSALRTYLFMPHVKSEQRAKFSLVLLVIRSAKRRSRLSPSSFISSTSSLDRTLAAWAHSGISTLILDCFV